MNRTGRITGLLSAITLTLLVFAGSAGAQTSLYAGSDHLSVDELVAIYEAVLNASTKDGLEAARDRGTIGLTRSHLGAPPEGYEELSKRASAALTRIGETWGLPAERDRPISRSHRGLGIPIATDHGTFRVSMLDLSFLVGVEVMQNQDGSWVAWVIR